MQIGILVELCSLNSFRILMNAGLFVTKGIVSFPLDYSFPETKVPWTFRSLHMDHSYRPTLDHSFNGLFVRKTPATYTILRMHGARRYVVVQNKMPFHAGNRLY